MGRHVDPLAETLAIVDGSDEPLTTPEVAAQLDVGRRSTYDRLERLTETGDLATKKVGANARIWWRPDSADEFESLVDAVEEYAIFSLDQRGHVRSWNRGARRIKGYERSEILGEHIARFYTDDAVEAGVPERNLAEAAETGSTEDEGWRVRADGSQFWANVTITAITDDSGQLEGFAKVTRDMTTRRRYERELEEQTRRLETELDEIFERIADGFYTLDEALRFRYVNDHAMETLDLDESVIGRDFRTVVDTTDAFDAALERAIEEQEPVIFEDYYDPVDRWFYNALYPSETGLSVYFRDITEEKRRDRELREAKAKLEAATEAGAVGTWEWDVQADRFVAGGAIASHFGVDEADLEAGVTLETVLSGVHEADRDRVERAIQAALEDCGEYEADYRVHTADGEVRWVVARGSVECDVDGTPLTFPGAVVDITRRKRAELALSKRTEELETLFRVLPVGAVVAEADGSIHRTNDVAREIVGVEASSIDAYDQLSTRWADSGEPVAADERTLVRVLEGEVVTEPDTYEIETAEGATRTIMVHGMPVRDDSGEVTRAIATIADITERREYEARLEESNRRLEQFAYSASHDLQEPLRMVSSFLQLLEDRHGDELSDDAAEYLEYAVDGADRMREMIQGLLAYSRVETMGEPFEPVDLEAVLAEVEQGLQVAIAERDAALTVDPLPTVSGDRPQLRQLFQNLVANALEYADDTPRIHVEAERAGDRWAISVTDDGIGIDTDDQERIFEVFGRLHGPEEHEGTGIGLAIAQRIAERHGGTIDVESTPGEGSTFTVTLPAV